MGDILWRYTMGRRNYVNNKEFLQALIDYKKKREDAERNNEEPPIIPNYIGECIYQIANRLATKPNFAGYSYRDEMVSDGLENAIQAINNFDPNMSSNPFAYFTQIIWYAYLRRIEKEKKQLYIKHKVTEHAVISNTIIDKSGADSGEASYVDLDSDYMNSFVTSFEKRLGNKRKKAEKGVGIEKFIEGDDE
jgi:DNA-directed RNA polymerase specialized sigma subunit